MINVFRMPPRFSLCTLPSILTAILSPSYHMADQEQFEDEVEREVPAVQFPEEDSDAPPQYAHMDHFRKAIAKKVLSLGDTERKAPLAELGDFSNQS